MIKVKVPRGQRPGSWWHHQHRPLHHSSISGASKGTRRQRPSLQEGLLFIGNGTLRKSLSQDAGSPPSSPHHTETLGPQTHHPSLDHLPLPTLPAPPFPQFSHGSVTLPASPSSHSCHHAHTCIPISQLPPPSNTECQCLHLSLTNTASQGAP